MCALTSLSLFRCTPTTNPFGEVNTIPNELMAEYYVQRATAGLVITEATAISEHGAGWLNAPRICTSAQVEGWKRVTDRVHQEVTGSVIYMQLWHMGRQCHSSFHPTDGRVLAPSTIAAPELATTSTGDKVPYELPSAMTIQEIKDTIQEHVDAAMRAKEAGFDGIELDAASGYLLDTFLQSSTNERTDEYGGSQENRVRIVEQIVQAIVSSGAFPAHRIGIRISPNVRANSWRWC